MSIKKKFVTGALWVMLGTSFQQVSAFIIFVILARALSPAEFGIVAFATIFIDLSRIFVAAGTADAVIRHPEWDEVFASTAFWINLGISLFVCALFIVVGAPLLATTGYDGIQPILIVLSLTIPVSALNLVLGAKLRREFAFKQITTRDMISNVVAGLIGIALAFLGFGVWALVAQRVCSTVLACTLTWLLVRWRPRLVFSRSHARELLRFALNVTGAQAVSVANTEAIPLILGFLMGPVPLALYRTGNRGLRLVTQLTIAPLQHAALSAFSRVGKQSLADSYQRMTRATSVLACPVFIGAAAIAPDFVAICFGPQWNASGPVMAALGLMVGASTLNYFLTPVLIAAGYPRYLLYFFIATLIGNVLFTLASLPFGLTFVAASQTVRAYLGLPLSLGFLKKTIALAPFRAIAGVIEPLLAAFVMGGIVFALRVYALDDLSAVIRVAIVVPIGVAIYVGALLLFGRKFLKDNLAELIPLLPPFVGGKIARAAKLLGLYQPT